jgi:hypothetical protein
MPSACPGFAAAIPVFSVPAPVWPVGEDCELAPRSCLLFSSWANAATQSCNNNTPITTTLVQPTKGFIAWALFSWIPRAAQLPRLSLCKVSPCGFRGKTWEVLSTNVVIADLRVEDAKPVMVAGFLRMGPFDRARKTVLLWTTH